MHKKEKKTAKRTSIRKQFAGIFIGLMAGTILLCWFLNSGFFQKYYISNKKAVLMRMYEELGEAVANGEIDTDEYQLSLQQQCSKYNLSLLVLNANSEVVADSGGGSEFLKQQLLQHLFALSGEKYEIMENGNNYIVARVFRQSGANGIYRRLGHSDGRILFYCKKCAGRNPGQCENCEYVPCKRRYFLSNYQRYCDLDCFPQGDDADSAAGGHFGTNVPSGF